MIIKSFFLTEIPVRLTKFTLFLNLITYDAFVLHGLVRADAAYLVLPKARSRAAAWYILGNDPTTTPTPMNNSPVHVMCNTIKNVMSSAAEAESGGLFLAAHGPVQCESLSPNSVTLSQ